MQARFCAFFRAAFLRHEPRRHAVMQPQRADRKYDDHPGELTDTQIAAHLTGRAAYAVPAVEAGLCALLPFDIDAGGEAAARALLDEATRRGLWAWAQYDPERGRGYVWVPFDDLAAAPRMHTLAEHMLNSIRPQAHEWRIENRATEADTRLPFARHRWSGKRGLLLTQDGQCLDLDAGDLCNHLEAFTRAYQENDTHSLPAPVEAPPEARRNAQEPRNGPGVTIAVYNTRTGLAELLERYGARKARGQGARLYFCPFHADDHASLLLTRDGERCHCLSQGSECPLSGKQHDAFNVFCTGEGLTPAQALRQLNGRPKTAGGQPPPTANRRKDPQEARNDHAITRPSTQRRFAAVRPSQARAEASAPLDSPWPSTSGLPKSARRVLEVIHHYPGGYLRGKYHLARLLDIDPRTVQRSLRRLESDGLIERQQRGRDGQTDIYRALPQDTPGGRHLPPTMDLEILSNSESLETDKGGQPAPKPSNRPDERGVYHGPGGAVAYLNGAAYVPPEAERWYSQLMQQNTPATAHEEPAQADYLAATEAEQALSPQEVKSAPPRRRRKKEAAPVPPGQLVSRIIAATRKAEKLEKGRAHEQRQARAIRRSIQALEQQLAQARAEQATSGYTAEECERWLAEHAKGRPTTPTRPPLRSLLLPEVSVVSGLIARLRQRKAYSSSDGSALSDRGAVV